MEIKSFLWDIVYIEQKSFLTKLARTASRAAVTALVVLCKSDIQCKVPPSTVFSHGGINVVISRNVKIGEHCIIGQNVTIGIRSGPGVPTIGDYCVINPNALIVGDINIGHHSIIGGGAVVLHSVSPYSVVVGNPARVIHRISSAIEYDAYRRKRQ